MEGTKVTENQHKKEETNTEKNLPEFYRRANIGLRTDSTFF